MDIDYFIIKGKFFIDKISRFLNEKIKERLDCKESRIYKDLLILEKNRVIKNYLECTDKVLKNAYIIGKIDTSDRPLDKNSTNARFVYDYDNSEFCNISLPSECEKFLKDKDEDIIELCNISNKDSKTKFQNEIISYGKE